MFQLLKFWIENWLNRRMEQLKQLEKPEEADHSPCPICGEEWEKGAIYCYFCGYEEKDVLLPLNPRPERPSRDEAIADPDNVIDEETKNQLNGKLAEIQMNRGFQVAIYVLPREMAGFIGKEEDGPGKESLDGFAYNLYNTWLMGRETKMKGLLMVADPVSGRRALVTGREGPSVNGSDFRDWFAYEGEWRLEDELSRVVERISNL